MPGATTLSNRTTQEKRKVMAAAKHPIESSLGRTLLKTNFSDESALTCELYKLDKMKKRHRMHSKQEKKSFLQNRNLPEPTLIVERPPSPETLRKCYPNVGDTQPEFSRRPRYMQQLSSRVRTPSNFVTLDAFSVKTKKKTNYWDVTQDSAELLRFQSTFVPSFRLTTGEISELQRACSMHPGFQRPLSATGEKLAASGDNQNRQLGMRQRTPRSRQKKKPRNPNPDPNFDRDPDTVFITELHSNHHQENTDRAIRTVTFANMLKTDDKKLFKSKNKRRDSADDGVEKENNMDGSKVGIKQEKLYADVQNENKRISIRVKEKKNGQNENQGIAPINVENKPTNNNNELVAVNAERESQENTANNIEPPDGEEPDMKEEIRKWIKKTYTFF